MQCPDLHPEHGLRPGGVGAAESRAVLAAGGGATPPPRLPASPRPHRQHCGDLRPHRPARAGGPLPVPGPALHITCHNFQILPGFHAVNLTSVFLSYRVAVTGARTGEAAGDDGLDVAAGGRGGAAARAGRAGGDKLGRVGRPPRLPLLPLQPLHLPHHTLLRPAQHQAGRTRLAAPGSLS